MQMNFENGKLVITETLEHDSDYVLGSFQHHLDLHKYTGHGCSWNVMPIPVLLSRAIRNNWSITVETEGKSIIIGDETLIGVKRLMNKQRIISKDLKLVRWHSDFIIFKDEYQHISFHLENVKTISLRLITGVDELDNLDIIPEITITPDRSEKHVKWDVKATTKNPCLLEGIINDIQKNLKYHVLQEGVKEQIEDLISKTNHGQARNILGTPLYVVKSLDALVNLFLTKGFYNNGFPVSDKANNFNKLLNSEKVVVCLDGNRFNFIDIDYIEFALKG